MEAGLKLNGSLLREGLVDESAYLSPPAGFRARLVNIGRCRRDEGVAL